MGEETHRTKWEETRRGGGVKVAVDNLSCAMPVVDNGACQSDNNQVLKLFIASF